MLRQHSNTLKLSVVGLTALLASEGFSSAPYKPNPHDRPTIGFGTTFYPDGSAVKMTDPRISRQLAIEYAGKHIEKDEEVFRKTLGDIPLFLREYEVYIDFMYQYGAKAWTNSSMLTRLKRGDYVAACTQLLEYRKITIRPKGGLPYKFDCSTPNNKICRGVWTRQLERYNKCLGID